MKTFQTNVRVELADKPLIRMIAARLRAEPGFRARLEALLKEDGHSDLVERLARLERQVDALAAAGGVGACALPRPNGASPEIQ